METSTLARGRTRLRPLAVLAAAVAVLLAAMLSFAGAAFADGSISASPTSGVHDGQTIAVTGSGFNAGDAVQVYFCDFDKKSGYQPLCTDSGKGVQVTADAGGKFSASVTAKEKFGDADCTKDKCGAMSYVPNGFKTSQVTVTFGASLPTGVSAGQADTGSQLLPAIAGGIVALFLLGLGGYLVRTTKRESV